MMIPRQLWGFTWPGNVANRNLSAPSQQRQRSRSRPCPESITAAASGTGPAEHDFGWDQNHCRQSLARLGHPGFTDHLKLSASPSRNPRSVACRDTGRSGASHGAPAAAWRHVDLECKERRPCGSPAQAYGSDAPGKTGRAWREPARVLTRLWQPVEMWRKTGAAPIACPWVSHLANSQRDKPNVPTASENVPLTADDSR